MLHGIEYLTMFYNIDTRCNRQSGRPSPLSHKIHLHCISISISIDISGSSRYQLHFYWHWYTEIATGRQSVKIFFPNLKKSNLPPLLLLNELLLQLWWTGSRWWALTCGLLQVLFINDRIPHLAPAHDEPRMNFQCGGGDARQHACRWLFFTCRWLYFYLQVTFFYL